MEERRAAYEAEVEAEAARRAQEDAFEDYRRKIIEEERQRLIQVRRRSWWLRLGVWVFGCLGLGGSDGKEAVIEWVVVVAVYLISGVHPVAPHPPPPCFQEHAENLIGFLPPGVLRDEADLDLLPSNG